MISFFTLLLIFSSWTQIKVYGVVFTRFAGVWSAQSFRRGLARSCCAAMCAHSDANNALLSPQPAKSVTCAPALVCPMALARPLAQLCNNKSLQPVLDPFCRHKWAGLGLTHLANRKRCWFVPHFILQRIQTELLILSGSDLCCFQNIKLQKTAHELVKSRLTLGSPSCSVVGYHDENFIEMARSDNTRLPKDPRVTEPFP